MSLKIIAIPYEKFVPYFNKVFVICVLIKGQGADIIMNVSEQQISLLNTEVSPSLRAVVGTQLGASLLNDEASRTSLQLPLISPEVINLSGIRPHDESHEGLLGEHGIGISPSEHQEFGYEGSRRQPLDLHTLWRLLAQMDKQARRNGLIGNGNGRKNVGLNTLDGSDVGDHGDQDVDDSLSESGKMSTWELVVLQAVLLSLLIFISLLWAFCCKRKCLSDQPLMTEMVALARKISSSSSKDLPPSYSKVDLTQEGLTLDDHFNPPPNYDRAADLYHLEAERKRVEAEGGGTRSITPAPDYTPMLSFHQSRIRRIQSATSVGSLSRSSISSAVEQHQLEDVSEDRNNSTCVVSIESVPSSSNQFVPKLIQRTPKTSVTSTASSTSSNSSSSRKASRVKFSPILEEGPTSRKDSSQSVPCKSVLVHRDSDDYRKRSAVSEGGEGSRKVSFVYEEISVVGNQERANKKIRTEPDPNLEKLLQAQLELARQAGEMDDFISSSNNLNNEGVKSSPPMI